LANQSEFDCFADDYERVHDRTLPPGAKSRDFLLQKAGMVKRWAKERFKGRGPLSVLDFGCSTGRLLAAIADEEWCQSLTGVDPSAVSLQTARQALSGKSKPVALARKLADLGGERRYDLLLMFNVMHHIPSKNRLNLVRQMGGVLKQDGVLAVWEHNPFNPMTRLLVALSPMDEHAQLISRRRVVELMQECGFSCVDSRFVNCFPPQMSSIAVVAWLEDALSGAPVGTQYWSLFCASTGREEDHVAQ